MISAGARSTGSKPKVYLGNFKQSPRPYAENTGPGTNGNWPPMMHPPSMIPWATFSPQQMSPHFAARPAGSIAPPFADPPSNPPHTPESQSSEGASRGAPHHAQAPHRNENPINRSGSVEQPPPLMQGPPPQYPMGYMPPFPAPYPMGFPTQAFGYSYPMHPQMQGDSVHGPMPAYGAQHFGHPPINTPPKAPQLQHSASSKTDPAHKDGSSELEEDHGSKSSEATNNGVNNNVTPTQHSEVSGYYQEGRPPQGQTLYVGNLAPGVEESLLMHYFVPYGPISNVQVIRDRETQMSRGYGFVTFVHPFYAQTAMQHMDSVTLLGPFEGKKLKVSFSNRR